MVLKPLTGPLQTLNFIDRIIITQRRVIQFIDLILYHCLDRGTFASAWARWCKSGHTQKKVLVILLSLVKTGTAEMSLIVQRICTCWWVNFTLVEYCVLKRDSIRQWRKLHLTAALKYLLRAGRWKTSNPEACEVGGNLSIFMSSGLVPHWTSTCDAS